MDVKELKQQFMSCASALGDYSILTKTELADGYCDAEDAGDEVLRSAYISAIMLRYWFKLKQTKEKNPIHLTDETCYDIVLHGISYALEHRAWRDPEQAVYQDPNGPDKVINQCISSSYLIYMQTSNKDVRKANALTYSLDAGVDENGDCMLDSAGAIETPNYFNGAQGLVSKFLEQNRTIEALILDGIAYQDTSKEEKVTRTFTMVDDETGEEYEEECKGIKSSFDERKLVKHLNSINQKFMQSYFNPQYDITPEQGDEILNKLKSLNNTKLYKYIKKTIIQIRDDKELLQYLIG